MSRENNNKTLLNDKNADKVAQANKVAMEKAVAAKAVKDAETKVLQDAKDKETEMLAKLNPPTETKTTKELVADDRFQLLGDTGKIVFDTTDQKEHPFPSKSALMKFLFDEGMTIAQISHFTGNHYSFVHGVISASREIVHEHVASRSDEIRDLFDQGKKVGEIAKLLNANYSFVFGVIKKYKAAKEVA